MSLPSSTNQSDIQLPPELWDNIIDLVSSLYNDSWRRDVFACCLVCRAFTPRCRFQLYRHIDLRSAGNLAQVVDILTQYPALCQRVGYLIIDATTSIDQSWVSTVPFRLPLSQFSTQLGVTLRLRGIDLSLLHPNTHRAFTRMPRCIAAVVLDDIQYSNAQLARFCVLYDRVYVIYRDGSPRLPAVPDFGRLSRYAVWKRPPPPSGLARLTFTMPWATLGRITRDMDLSASVKDCIVRFIGEWPAPMKTSAIAVRNIRKAFRHVLSRQPGEIPRVDIYTGPWRIELGRGNQRIYVVH